MPRLVSAALVCASPEPGGCASVLRSSTQPSWFRNAPDDLLVLHWPGLIVDAVSQKGKNSDDVDVQVALAATHQAAAAELMAPAR